PEVARSEELQQAARTLSGSTLRLRRALAEANEISPTTFREIETVFRDSGILALADAIAQQTDDYVEQLRTILHRHEEVQSGKFDRGERKAPWLRLPSETGTVFLTAQRYQLPVNHRP